MLFSNIIARQRLLANGRKTLASACSVLLGAIAVSLVPPLHGQSGSPTIELTRVGTDGNNSTLRGPSGSGLAGGSGTFPARNHFSANGRYVAFESDSASLVCSDTNSARDIFLRDRQTGTTSLVNVSSAGVQLGGE